MSHVLRASRVIAIVLGGFLLVGCEDLTRPPGNGVPGEARLHLRVAVQAATIAGLTVEVTAPDIVLPIVLNIAVVGGIAEGTLTVPAGSDRRILVRAFNSDGIETHRGEATIDVLEGANPELQIVLDPVFGDVPVVVTIGGYSLAVEPSDVTLRVGDAVQLTVTVLDGAGDAVTRPVSWGSGNPVVAEVDETGRVTGRRVGETEVFASYGSFRDVVVVRVTPFRWVSVVAGEYHVCGLDDRGRAFCWGGNQVGQLGDGTVEPRSTPTPVAGGHTFLSLTAGGLQSCGVTTTGDGYCWGRAIVLGRATYADSATPVLVGGGHAWASIEMGIWHACGVTRTGEGYCWGWGNSGRLGNGSSADQLQPVPVSGGHRFVTVSAGRDHGCGVTTAGAALCWGYGGVGQLGHGAGSSSATPVAVIGGHLFDGVSAGGYHTCGVRRDGAGLCWGMGSQGQLGNGTRNTYAGPVAVSGGNAFVSIDAGGFHACGTTTDGDGLCWGYGSAGQMGNGTLPIAQPTPVGVTGGLDLVFATASGAPYDLWYAEVGGFSCGLTTRGGLFCWGDNSWGQLGDGTRLQRLLPTPVRDP